MHEIFSLTGWVQPISLASSHPRAADVTASSNKTPGSPKANKKDQIGKYLNELKEGRHIRAKEKEEKK